MGIDVDLDERAVRTARQADGRCYAQDADNFVGDVLEQPVRVVEPEHVAIIVDTDVDDAALRICKPADPLEPVIAPGALVLNVVVLGHGPPPDLDRRILGRGRRASHRLRNRSRSSVVPDVLSAARHAEGLLTPPHVSSVAGDHDLQETAEMIPDETAGVPPSTRGHRQKGPLKGKWPLGQR